MIRLNVRNRHLKAVYDIYYERMEEAKTYLLFMKDIKHCDTIQVSNKEVNISSLKYIINSSLSLMLYNIIENATTGMINSIHQDLIDNNIKHHELNSKLYKKFLKEINDKDIDFLSDDYSETNTINEKLVVLRRDRQRIFNGNVDCREAKCMSEIYGFNIPSNRRWLAGDILYIKNKRNELAHGAISFSDHGQDIDIGIGATGIIINQKDIRTNISIEKKLESVEKWLTCLFEGIDDYLDNQGYKKSA